MICMPGIKILRSLGFTTKTTAPFWLILLFFFLFELQVLSFSNCSQIRVTQSLYVLKIKTLDLSRRYAEVNCVQVTFWTSGASVWRSLHFEYHLLDKLLMSVLWCLADLWYCGDPCWWMSPPGTFLGMGQSSICAWFRRRIKNDPFFFRRLLSVEFMLQKKDKLTNSGPSALSYCEIWEAS